MPPPRRATVSVRGTRRLALRSLRHQHHGRPARLSRGPPPGPCTGRGPYPPHQGQWPGTVSVAGVQHQPDLADDHPDRSRPDRADPPARLRRRRRHVGNLRAEGAALPIPPRARPTRSQRTPTSPQDPGVVALGSRDRRDLRQHRRHPATGPTWPVRPRHHHPENRSPAAPAGPSSYPQSLRTRAHSTTRLRHDPDRRHERPGASPGPRRGALRA